MKTLAFAVLAIALVTSPSAAKEWNVPDDILAQCRHEPATQCTWITGELIPATDPRAKGEPHDVCRHIDPTSGRVDRVWATTPYWHRYPNGTVSTLEGCGGPEERDNTKPQT